MTDAEKISGHECRHCRDDLRAVQRPSLCFVPVKQPRQQVAMVLHRTRHLFVRQMKAVINALRAHLAEFGIIAQQGRNGVGELGKTSDPLPKDDRPWTATSSQFSLQRNGIDAAQQPTMDPRSTRHLMIRVRLVSVLAHCVSGDQLAIPEANRSSPDVDHVTFLSFPLVEVDRPWQHHRG